MSDENPWKSGDVVRIKSGGPPMTVAGENQLGMVICEWFVGTNQKSGTFHAVVLEKCESVAGSPHLFGRSFGVKG